MKRREVLTLLGGASLAWPLAARAQQVALPVIGFLTAVTENFVARERIAAFRAGLAEKGFVEGKNVAIEYRYADTHLERLPALAMDLVRRKVSVIFATGGDVPALIAKGATSTIPIVFGIGDDPVQAGLVSSLNRPGGMVTGATVIAAELAPKRLELLRQLVPTARSIAVLMNEDNPSAEIDTAATLAAARRLGCEIVILKAGTEDEVDKAFVRLAEVKADGLVVNPDPLFLNIRNSMVARVGHQNVPAIYYARDYADQGGLMSYGASFTDLYRICGVYVGRILAGEKPADLPVVQPTKFELVINLKTAKALGLTVPQSLLATADELIE